MDIIINPSIEFKLNQSINAFVKWQNDRYLVSIGKKFWIPKLWILRAKEIRKKRKEKNYKKKVPLSFPSVPQFKKSIVLIKTKFEIKLKAVRMAAKVKLPANSDIRKRIMSASTQTEINEIISNLSSLIYKNKPKINFINERDLMQDLLLTSFNELFHFEIMKKFPLEALAFFDINTRYFHYKSNFYTRFNDLIRQLSSTKFEKSVSPPSETFHTSFFQLLDWISLNIQSCFSVIKNLYRWPYICSSNKC